MSENGSFLTTESEAKNECNDETDINLTYTLLAKIENINRKAVLIELIVYVFFITMLITFFVYSYDAELNYNFSYGINNFLHKQIINLFRYNLTDTQIDINFFEQQLRQTKPTASAAYHYYEESDTPAYLFNLLLSYIETSSYEATISFIGTLINCVLYIVDRAVYDDGNKNSVIGNYLLRQIRVKQTDCNIIASPSLDGSPNSYNFTCYDESVYDLSKTPEYFYVINNKSSESYISDNYVNLTDIMQPNCPILNETKVNLWNYEKDNSYIDVMETMLGSYESDGYLIKLNPNCEKFNLKLLDYIFKKYNWIDRGTRALFFEIKVYNADINKFGNLMIFFEFLPTGGIESRVHTNINSLLFGNKIVLYTMFNVLLLLVFIIYYLVEEIFEIIEFKWKYFLLDWSITDITLLMCSFTILYYEFMLYANGAFTITPVSTDTNEFNSPNNQRIFQKLHQINKKKYFYVAVFCYIALFKLFKYLQIFQSMKVLIYTLRKCFLNVLEFALLFLVIFFAFIFTGYELFGVENLDYCTYTIGSITLLRLLLGDFDYRQYQQLNEFIGTLFFLSYIIIIYLLLSNMLVAIISEIYETIRQLNDNLNINLLNSNSNKFNLNNINNYYTTFFIKRNYKYLLSLFINRNYTNKSYEKNLIYLLINEINDINLNDVSSSVNIKEKENLTNQEVLSILKKLNYKSNKSLKMVAKRYNFDVNIKKLISNNNEECDHNWTKEKVETLIRNVFNERLQLENYVDLCIKHANEDLEKELLELNNDNNYIYDVKITKYSSRYSSTHGTNITIPDTKDKVNDLRTKLSEKYVLKNDLKKLKNIIDNIKYVKYLNIFKKFQDIKFKLQQFKCLTNN